MARIIHKNKVLGCLNFNQIIPQSISLYKPIALSTEMIVASLAINAYYYLELFSPT